MKGILFSNRILYKTHFRIILENSGVAEPQNIRDSFNEAIALEHPITSRIMLDGLITVVDAATFVTDFGSKAPLTMRPDLADGGGNARPVVDLLVEQIECADLIVLNKADAVDADKLEKLKPIVKSLNPLAHITQASFGRVHFPFRSKLHVVNTDSIGIGISFWYCSQNEHRSTTPKFRHGSERNGRPSSRRWTRMR